MKIVLFSDVHVHPFKQYSFINEKGINSRLQDCLDAIELTLQTAISEDADLVLFGGDLFHVRRNINVSAFNGVYDKIVSFSKNKIPLIMITGNHDTFDRIGEHHSIYSFRDLAKVIDVSLAGWCTVAGKRGNKINLFAVPYTEHLDKIKKGIEQRPVNSYSNIFLGHLGINGAKLGSDFVYYNAYDVNVADLSPKTFDAGFLGHFHEYQELGNNFRYIGAPLCHNWGDANQDRGILIYDTQTGIITRKILNLPKFVVCKPGWENDSTLQFKNKYVKIPVQKKWSLEEELSVMTISGARHVETFEVKEEEELHKYRSSIRPNMAFADMVERYVDLNDSKTLSKSELIAFGKQILDDLD